LANQIVFNSFKRIQEFGNDFWETFYFRFVQSNVEIQILFKDTNMENQYRMLSQSISYIMLNSNSESPHTTKHMVELITLHNKKLKIPKAHFIVWKECFLSTLKDFDPSYDELVEKTWCEAIDKMLAKFGI